MYWLEFIISSLIIIAAGIRLTIDADKLSDTLHFGKVWIGIVLLGVVTSLPEAVTSLVSIISLGADNLAVGNLVGSNNFNPVLIVIMDVLYRKVSLTNAIHPNASHKVSAGFAILLTGMVMADILVNRPVFTLPGGAVMTGGCLMVGLLYILGMRKLAQLSPGESVISPITHSAAQDRASVIKISVRLFVSALLVIAGAVWLAKSADILARETGLGGTFFGSIFLAIVTSLPEMVVSLSALRLGSLDLAVGNIFGSNMTNMFIVFLCSLFYRGGAMLGAVSKAHLITASLSIVLTLVAIGGICNRNKKTFLGLGWDSIVMLICFISGTVVLYQFRLL